MEVESSLVQTRQQKRPVQHDYTMTALKWGVPAAIVLVLALVADAVAGATVRPWPVVGALWSILFFMVVTICLCILVPCLSIIGWRVCKTLERHERDKTTYQQETATKRRELQLLDERVRAARLANLAVEQAMTDGDNYTITSNHDGVSSQIVRAAVLLEQSRLQHASRVQQQIQKEDKKQIAGPPSDPNKKYHPPVDTGGILTFAALLLAGLVADAAKDGFILLGYVDGLLRYGTWEDLYSCGIGGVSGSGKTTTVRFILFQAILAGARLLMIDPHLHDVSESLAAQFSMFKNIHIMKPCDDNIDAIMKRIRWMMAEYKRRKAKGIKGPPIILTIDEFNEVVRLLSTDHRKELAELLLYISQGGRKFGLFAMLIGQRWSQQDLGGSPHGASIRSSLAALLVHRFTDPQQAAKLVATSKVEECLELQEGHFFFRDTHGKCLYTVTPFTVSDDGIEIQRLLDELENTVESSLETAENRGQTLVSRHTTPLNSASFVAQSTIIQAGNSENRPEKRDIHTLARLVVKLQAENVQKPDIMKQVWGVSPGGSAAYQQALEEYKRVMQFIAEYLSGL